jgi:hypothetical protein
LFLTRVSAGLTSSSQSKPTERLLQPLGALGMRAAKLWKPLRENLLRTGARCAEKATHVQNELDRTPTAGKVMQSAPIPTLHTPGDGPTTGAASRWGRGPQRQRDLIGHLHLLDEDESSVWKDDERVQCVPRRREKLEKVFNFLV